MLLKLTLSLSRHLPSEEMPEFNCRPTLKRDEAVCLYMLNFSLRGARHEAAHAAALVLLHDLYTLEGVRFRYSAGEPRMKLQLLLPPL